MNAEPRPGLRGVAPYVSPQLEVAARLNTNECPHPLPQGFIEELSRVTHDLPLHRYPDGQMSRLREDLASHTGHPVEGIWIANGSNEIITELLQAYGGPNRRALTFEPTYLLHSRLSWLTHTDLMRHELDAPYTLDDAAIAAAVGVDPDIVFVCSPNNPTGNAQPVDAVASLAASLPTKLVIVDEAYIEFGGESSLKLVAEAPNIAVVRTFSKAFALAGARIGYTLTSPEIVGDLQRVRLPYHVSALTQATAITALKFEREAMGVLDAIRIERDRIVTALQRMPGVVVYPSDANFVLFVPPKPAAEVWQALLDRSVLVRDLSAVVPNALRVSAGATHEVDLFLDSLKGVLAA
jgi:histidinol-phosphate aminotransferase